MAGSSKYPNRLWWCEKFHQVETKTINYSLDNQNNILCYRRFDFTSKVFIRTKDRINDEEKPEVVYKISCKNCERVYVGETGRPLGVRIKEHRKEVDSITGIFTRAEKTRAASVCNKSAITDHVCNENHVIDWEKAKVIYRESDKSGRHMREAIWIRKTENMNRDWGSYQLSHVWDELLHTDDTRSQSWWKLPTWSRNVDNKVCYFGCLESNYYSLWWFFPCCSNCIVSFW